MRGEGLVDQGADTPAHGLVVGRNDPGFVHNGPLAGLVAICAGSDVMHPLGALVTGAVAGAIKAERLVLLTDVEGVLDQDKKVIPRLSVREARALIADGTISGVGNNVTGAPIAALMATKWLNTTVSTLTSRRNATTSSIASDGPPCTVTRNVGPRKKQRSKVWRS